MTESTREGLSVDFDDVQEKLKEVLHAGNIRRVIVRKDDRVVAEFPLTAAVIGAVVAPVLAAVGAITAVVADCRIEIERVEDNRPRDPGY